MKRRQCVKYLTASTAMAMSSCFWSCDRRAEGLKKILVLGGTNFVGPAVVRALTGAGYEVTLFNRGITNPTLFADLPLIKGDRHLGSKAYQVLQRKHWDVVVDVWPEKAGLVDEATAALSSYTDNYIFISSIAVYNDFQQAGLHENSPVVALPKDPSEWYYSEEKLAAERHVTDRFPDSHVILRPGPIKGWRDPAVDMLYWLIKLRDQQPVLAPGSGQDPLQFVDVKDVGRFITHGIRQNLKGIYNFVGPWENTFTWREFLLLARDHLSSRSSIHWAPEEFLARHGVLSFSDMPLWAPLSEDPGFMQISNEKLKGAGLKLSSVETTIDDCLKWYDSEVDKPVAFGTESVGVGLSAERETQLLKLLQEG